MNFIISFNIETGTVTSLDKAFDGEMVFEEYFSGTLIKVIGSSACRTGSLKSLNLYNTQIETIMTLAFADCSSLAEIVFPESLKDIGSNSFLKTSPTSIYIPKNVEYMSGYAWNQISTIFSFIVSPDNPFFSSFDGFLFDKNNIKLFRAPCNITNYAKIPYLNSIQAIGDFSFTSTQFSELIFNHNLYSIDTYSFHAMSKIYLIDLSKTKINTIPGYAFFSNSASRIILPLSITSILSYAFYGVPNIISVTIFMNVINIYPESFHNCPSLRRVIYYGQTNFSNISMFSGTTSLNAIKLYVTHNYIFDEFGYVPIHKFIEFSDSCFTFNINRYSSDFHIFLLFFFIFYK